MSQMTSQNRELSQEQSDTLGEIFNLGVGHAAKVLSEMTDKWIDLNVPAVHVLDSTEVKKKLLKKGEDTVSIEMDFSGAVSGASVLMFDRNSAIKLASLLLEEEIDKNAPDGEWSETTSEVGNIVVNSVIGALANSIEEELDYSPPIYSNSQPAQIVDKTHEGEDGLVIVAEAELKIKESSIFAEVLIVFALGSFKELKIKIDELYLESA